MRAIKQKYNELADDAIVAFMVVGQWVDDRIIAICERVHDITVPHAAIGEQGAMSAPSSQPQPENAKPRRVQG